jgi:hypothetical protein
MRPPPRPWTAPPAGRELLVVAFVASALPGDERSAPGEERKRELDEVRQRRHGPGDDGRPALAMARVGGEVLGADGGDLDGRGEAGRGHGRLEERRLLAIDSTSSARSAGSGGRERDPGKAAAAAEVDERPDPSRRSSGPAARLSRTCRRAISSGSRAAVRLIAAFQASRRRTWPSIAARASGAGASPIAARPFVESGRELRRSSGRP